MLVKTTLRKLSNVKVSHVSLVERGANRIPFRIIKAQKPEESAVSIDLAKRFKQESVQKPEVVGIITFDRGEVLMPAINEALTGAGFSVDNVRKEEDGTVYFEQSATVDGEETHLIRLSDQMAVVVKGLSEVSAELTAAPFAERLKAQGYFEGVRNSTNVFSQALVAILSNDQETSAVKAEEQLKGLIEDFGNYVMTLTSALPATVFKADESLCALSVSKDEQTETEVDLTEPPTPKVEIQVDTNTQTEVVKSDAADDALVAKAKAEQEAATAKGIAEIVKAAMEPIATAMTAMVESFKALSVKQDAMDIELKTATVKAEKAEKAVTTTTTAQAQSDPSKPASAAVAKGEDSHVELFDTAYAPRRR